MKRKIGILLVIAMLAMGVLACLSSSGGGGGEAGCVDYPADISGSYNVNGTNQDGSEYFGSATIENAGGNSYRITWQIADQFIEGVGTYSGGVYTVDDGTFINTYNASCNGTLDGVWSQRGVDGQGTEILTK